MNLTALIARCKTRFRDEDEAVVTTAEWTDYLNDAYFEVVAARPDWPFLDSRDETLSVTAGAGSTTLPTDGWRVAAVYNATDKFALEVLDGRAEYRRLFPNPASALGTPQYYRLFDNTIEVFPWPAATTELDVDLFLPPTALSAGADEPVFPEQYHRVLVEKALALAHTDDGNLEQAGVHEQHYGILLGNLADDLLGSRGDRYPQIIDTFGS